MQWNGERLKKICEERGFTRIQLAERLETSRQTVHSWLAGQVPKGHHLLKLCRVLDIEPIGLFDAPPVAVSVPVHRAKANVKVTDKRQQLAHELAVTFAPLFEGAQRADVLLVIRTDGYGADSAQQTASKLRSLAEVPDEKPCTYDYAFRLLAKLGCFVVFVPFPPDVKSYAFYSAIHGNRVVFVNQRANVLDLVFCLLHEAVHSAFDEQQEVSKELEDYCDAVASAVQFPQPYVSFVRGLLKGLSQSQKLQIIKELARENGHALFGLAKALVPDDKAMHQAAARMDNVLRKHYPTIDALLFAKGDSADYISRYRQLSPLFCQLIEAQSDNLSARRLGELMGLESELDAAQIKELTTREREAWIF